VDQGLSLKSSRDEFMSNIIRFFGVEAVWKRPVLPPHLPNICQSDGCKAVFSSVEGGGKMGEQNLGDMLVIQLWENEQAFMNWWNSEEYRPWKEMRGEGAEVTLSISQQRPD
jgi:uncharacterized protein (DUF1330 family)